MKKKFIRKIEKLLIILLRQQPVIFWAGSNLHYMKK